MIESVGRKIRALREARGWSRAELCGRAGISVRFLAEVETGEANLSLLRLLERKEAGSRPGRERHNQPYGRTLAFQNDCMASHGPSFVRSWVSMRTCEFSEDTIFTMGIVVDKLNAVAGGLLNKHGVRVVRCQDVTDRVYADEDARRADRPAPKKRSY